MTLIGLLMGAAIVVIVLAAWYQWHQRIKGGNGGLLSGKSNRPPAEDLEAFIAAYRRGEVNPAAMAPTTPAGPAAPPQAAAPVPATTAAGVQSPARREAFLSGPARVVYLSCRAGLRDHHCFANVRLQSLCTGQVAPALQSASVDLLVCDAALAIVAAIDIATDAPPLSDAAKAECLRTLGIRHLKLSPKALPRPDELRNLLYRA